MAIRNLLLTVATVAIAGTILFGFSATVPFWGQRPSASAQTTTENPLNCSDIASRLGGLPVPNGPVCDVVVVRQSPQITGSDGMNLTQFTLMNSVLEFTAAPSNATTGGGEQPATSQQVYVMGDFALRDRDEWCPGSSQGQWLDGDRHTQPYDKRDAKNYLHALGSQRQSRHDNRPSKRSF